MPPEQTPRVRISGITAAVRRLRTQLKAGSPRAARAAAARAGQLLAAIEALFTSGKIDPAALTPASARAYQELQRIQSAQPLRTSVRPKKIRLANGSLLNLSAHLARIQASLADAAAGSLVESQAFTLVGNLSGEIEVLLQKAGVQASDLNASSQAGYRWLVYISQQANFHRHLLALQRFVAAASSPGGRKPAAIKVWFCSQTASYRYQRSQAEIALQLNEGFIDAPPEVFRALATVCSGSRSQGARRLITAYTISPAYLEVTRHLAGPPAAPASGAETRLGELFNRINRQYFGGMLSRPHLAWNPRASLKVLGTYTPASDSIVISAALQDAGVPPYVLEYVMYHEMLHKELGTRLAGGTRRVHTAEFRRREAQFEDFARAQAWLRSAGLKRNSLA